MSSWTASPTRTFLNELLDLPRSVSKQVPRKVELLEQDPISAQGDAKKLKDYENVYRVRIGNYRLFYTFGQGWIKLLSIRKRDERTYTVLDSLVEFDHPAVPPEQALLEPQAIRSGGFPQEISVTDFPSLDESDTTLQPSVTNPVTTALPRNLTEALLQQWQIPQEFWAALTHVQYSEALLDLPIPAKYLERVLDNLFPRPLNQIKFQPEYLLQNPDDLNRFVEGSLSDFLLKLDPEQERLKDFGGKGPTLVKGGPGTGKSTLAIYRVAKLRERGCTPILFTTYTQALVGYSEQLLEQLLGQPPQQSQVEVTTVDSLANRYYQQVWGKPKIATIEQCITYLDKALQIADIPARNVFERQVYRQALERLGSSYLLQEFQDVIESWGISNLEDYLTLERKGRGTPLKHSLRVALWAVYEKWNSLIAQNGLVTWGAIRLRALDSVRQLMKKPYQAVIIDEAQDLSPTALRFLLALVPNLEGIYLTADASQSLYQRGFSWKQIHADLKVAGRTLLLKRNYRNTKQITDACTTILKDTHAGDSECLIQELSPHQGNVPVVCLTDDFDEENTAIQEFFVASAREFRLPLHGGAVLCPDSRIGYAIAQRLTGSGVQAKFVSGKQIDLNAPYIKVLTLHSAKGLEFPFVVVAGLRDGQLPYLPPNLPLEEKDEVIDEQRRLFYVGCSRAMRSLMVCGSRSKPSLFLNSLHHPQWQR